LLGSYRPEIEERRQDRRKATRSENKHYPIRIKSAPGGNRTRGLVAKPKCPQTITLGLTERLTKNADPVIVNIGKVHYIILKNIKYIMIEKNINNNNNVGGKNKNKM
jgi:hypothetical protein